MRRHRRPAAVLRAFLALSPVPPAKQVHTRIHIVTTNAAGAVRVRRVWLRRCRPRASAAAHATGTAAAHAPAANASAAAAVRRAARRRNVWRATIAASHLAAIAIVGPRRHRERTPTPLRPLLSQPQSRLRRPHLARAEARQRRHYVDTLGTG